MRFRFVVALLILAAGTVQGDAQDVKGCVYPDGMVPYHVHADLVAAISNLAERVSALEARHARSAKMRAEARKRAASAVPVRKRVNEVNAILKKRYPEKKK